MASFFGRFTSYLNSNSNSNSHAPSASSAPLTPETQGHEHSHATASLHYSEQHRPQPQPQPYGSNYGGVSSYGSYLFPPTTGLKFFRVSLSMANDLFGYPLRRFPWTPAVFRQPSGAVALLDWLETSNAHIFKVDVPGFSKDELKVEIEEGNVMHITGNSGKEESVEKEGIWHLGERQTGKRNFSREIELPENVKLDQIKAQLENGLLTIVVPKDITPRPSKVRKINIISKI